MFREYAILNYRVFCLAFVVWSLSPNNFNSNNDNAFNVNNNGNVNNNNVNNNNSFRPAISRNIFMIFNGYLVTFYAIRETPT